MIINMSKQYVVWNMSDPNFIGTDNVNEPVCFNVYNLWLKVINLFVSPYINYTLDLYNLIKNKQEVPPTSVKSRNYL